MLRTAVHHLADANPEPFVFRELFAGLCAEADVSEHLSESDKVAYWFE